MVMYKIGWEIFKGSSTYIGTDFVEGKSVKDATKNWMFSHFDDIIFKGFYTNEFKNYKFELKISKATIIKKIQKVKK